MIVASRRKVPAGGRLENPLFPPPPLGESECKACLSESACKKVGSTKCYWAKKIKKDSCEAKSRTYFSGNG